MISTGRFCFLFAMVSLTASAANNDYDFVVRNGRIIDGSGNPSFHGDIAVKDGRIVARRKGRRPVQVANSMRRIS
jgi:adenine deaminase